MNREERRRRLIGLQKMGERLAREAEELLADDGDFSEKSTESVKDRTVSEMDRERARRALRRIGARV